MSFLGSNRFDDDDWGGPTFEVCTNATASLFTGGWEYEMPYSITLRSRTDAKIVGWHQDSDGRWTTDHNRQRVFDKKSDARPVCQELRRLCPRNAKVINIEAQKDDLS